MDQVVLEDLVAVVGRLDSSAELALVASYHRDQSRPTMKAYVDSVAMRGSEFYSLVCQVRQACRRYQGYQGVPLDLEDMYWPVDQESSL